MKSFTIRRFTGIETKYEASDQNRGTLQRCFGVVPCPVGALSNGPKWASAWGLTNLGTLITSALSAGCAAGAGVHFVTVSKGGHTFLVAWDNTAGRSVGHWHVAGTGDPSLSSGCASVTINSPYTAACRNKTAGLRWFGNWVGPYLWLGNGTDANLICQAGVVSILGPASLPTEPDDPSQYQFPPCKAFVADVDGVVYGSGNVTYPLRVWRTEPPSVNFPYNQGLRTQENYRDVTLKEATTVTALSSTRVGILAHLDYGGAVLLTGVGIDGSSAGWRARQVALIVNAGAINQNCVQGTARLAPYYIGRDLEIYKPAMAPGHRKEAPRDEEIITSHGSEDWNRDMVKPMSGDDYAAIYDEKNDRFWVVAPLAASSRMAIWGYIGLVNGAVGPILYPDLLSVAKIELEELPGCTVTGITRDGVFLFSNLYKVGSQDIADWPTPGTSLGPDYDQQSSPPTPDAGLPIVGITIGCASSFQQVLNGQTVSAASAWSDFATSDVAPTAFFKNATFAVFEALDEDFGDPTTWKEFCQVRLSWHRDSAAYVGIAGESETARFVQWYGRVFEDNETILPMELAGRWLTIRIIAVVFNNSPAMLDGLTIDWLPGAPA
jgi:hypothetical protein